MRETITAVVVTFNRKLLLLRCIEAILKQTFVVDSMIIVDNASTDGTLDLLVKKEYLLSPPEDVGAVCELANSLSSTFDHSKKVKLHYVRMQQNFGSSGGFNEGIKRAYEEGFDWLWLMDDDGFPEHDCLERLMRGRSGLSVFSSAVVYEDEPSRIAAGLRIWDSEGRLVPKRYVETLDELRDLSKGGLYRGQANFFNSVILNRKVVEKVGNVDPNLFIWGDEVDYMLRCQEAGFDMAVVVESLHYHPNKAIGRLTRFNYYYFVRNTFYNHWKHRWPIDRGVRKYLYSPYVAAKLMLMLSRVDGPVSFRYLAKLARAVLWAKRGDLLPYSSESETLERR